MKEIWISIVGDNSLQSKTSGWHDESYRHRLAGMGIGTSMPILKSRGHRKFRGKEKYIVKDYRTYSIFKGAIQRAVNSTFGDKYYWNNDKLTLENTRTKERKEMTLKEAFESEDVWGFPNSDTLKIGQHSAFLQENYGNGNIGGFDIRWDEDIVGGEGDGHIYVYMGEYQAL